MEKERCSNCGLSGHDSRMCKRKVCLKLFGVNILDHKSTRRSVSMGNLESQNTEPNYHQDHVSYHSESEGQVSSKRRRIEDGRRKPKPWTEEEHQKFLEGLETIGKGKWKSIAESYVTTKTPIQVASHAQKFFLRQASSNKKTKRSSIFDTPFQEFAVNPLRNSPLAMKTMSKTSHQARSSSSVMPLNQTSEIPGKNSTSSQIVNGFSHPRSNPDIIPLAPNHGTPNYLEIPCVLSMSSHGAVNSQHQRSSHVNQPGTGNLGNFVIFATPITVHPYGIPAPPHAMFLAAPRISTEEEDLPSH